MRKLLVLIALAAVCAPAAADGLEQGDREMSFRASYSDTDLGATGGLDLGSIEDTELSLTYGWLVRGGHEFGMLVGYVEQDIDGGSFFANESSDGTQLGGFYTYNFSAGTNLNPYIGVAFSSLGGDLGDSYDFQYGAEAGLKVYPFDHGGFSFGLNYTELRSDAQGLPDADGISLGLGLLLKY